MEGTRRAALARPRGSAGFGAEPHLLKRVGEIRHAVPNRAPAERLRRGPNPTMATPTRPLDLAFELGAAGVTGAAACLGVVLALAQPSWGLGAATLSVGALLAAFVVFRPFSGRGGAGALSS